MIDSNVTDWDRLPNGDIATAPMIGWAMAAFPMNVMIPLEMLTEAGDTQAVQIHMPAHRVAEFAEALLQKAGRAMASAGQVQN